MTSASQTTNRGNAIEGTPFDHGAGHVVPSKALDPGLIYDAGQADYEKYACVVAGFKTKTSSPRKTKAPSYCPTYCKSTRGTKRTCKFPQGLFTGINMPSFSFPALASKKKYIAVRTVTYVGSGAATFVPELDLPTGFTGRVLNGTVVLASLSFSAPGETATYSLEITVAKTKIKGWSFGSLAWVEAGSSKWVVNSPIALQLGTSSTVVVDGR